MKDTYILILLAPILVAFTLIIMNYALKFVYDYKLTESGIEIVLASNFTVYNIPYKDIKETRKCSFLEIIISFSLGNRLSTPILVEKKRGLVRRIIFTPDNPEQFIVNISKHIK